MGPHLPVSRLAAPALLAVVALIPLGSCSSGGDGAPPEEGDYFEADYEFFPSTKPLEDGDLRGLRSVSADLTVFEFAAPLSERVAGLQSHDVILGGLTPHTPRGFLRVVHSTETLADGGLRVHTRETSIAFAFRKLKLRTRQTIAPEAVAVREDALRQPLALETTASFDEVVWDGDRDHGTLDDQIRIGGSVTPRVTFELSVDVDWPDSVWDFLVPIDITDPLGLPFDIDVTATLDSTASAEAELWVRGAAGLSFEEQLPLGWWLLGYIPLPFPFFFLTVELDLDAEIYGGTSALFEAGVRGWTGEAGFHVVASTDDAKDEGPRTIDPEPGYEVIEPSVDARAWVGVRVGPRISALLWGVVGPQVGLAAMTELEADPLREPCWDLEVGFDLDLGLELRPFLDETWPFPLIHETVADGGCRLPPASGSDEEPPFTPWAKAFTDTASVRGGWTDLTRVTDGRYLLASDRGRALTKVTSDGGLVWAREYDLLDPDEGTVPLYFQHVEPTRGGSLIAAAHPPTFVGMDLGGTVRWARRARLVPHGSPALNGGIVELDNGHLLAASAYQGAEDAYQDLLILRMTRDGQLLDARRWGDGQRGEAPTRIARWGDGWVVVGRTDYAPSGVPKPAWIVELDRDGELVRSYLFDSVSEFVAARQVESGGLLVGGVADRPGGYRAVLLKLRQDREIAWHRVYDSTSGAGEFGLRLTSVTETPFGYLLAAGTLEDYGSDTWIAALDTAGRLDWIRAVGGDGVNLVAPDIVGTEDHGVLVAVLQDLRYPASGYGLLKVWRKDGRIDFPPGSDLRSYIPDASWDDRTAPPVPGPAELSAADISWAPVELVEGVPDELEVLHLAP